MELMQEVCYYCGILLREGDSSKGISHGTCDECRKDLLEESEIKKGIIDEVIKSYYKLHINDIIKKYPKSIFCEVEKIVDDYYVVLRDEDYEEIAIFDIKDG